MDLLADLGSRNFRVFFFLPFGFLGFGSQFLHGILLGEGKWSGAVGRVRKKGKKETGDSQQKGFGN